MKLAIESIKSFLQDFTAADKVRQMVMAYRFAADELPIVLEEMQEAQERLDRGGDRDGGNETGD